MPQATGGEPITVEVEGLGTVEFPAGTDEATMKRAIDTQLAQSHVQQGQAVPHPIVQRMLSWLPAIGGAAGGILGGAVGAPAMGIGALPAGIGGAMMGGAAGKSLENIGNALVGNPAPASVPEALGSVGTSGLAQGAMEAAGGAMTAGAAKVAPALMQSAVKPGLKATVRAVSKGVPQADLPVVKTLLNEGVNVTPGGITKLNRIIQSTNADIRAAINDLPATIDPMKVAKRASGVEARAANQVNPAADVSAVRESVDEFLKNPKTSVSTPAGRVPTPITPAVAQDLKTGTYDSLSSKAYGELKAPAVETQKALARGLREEIESEAAKSGVNVRALNAREGGAIVAKEAIAKRLAAAGNRDPVALAWLAHNPTSGLLFILERSPGVKSMISRGLYQSAERASGVPQNVLRLLVTSIASASEGEQP